MKRKVNLVGTNTLTVSLPTKWVKANGIKKGDEIELAIKNKELLISRDNIPGENSREITINIDRFNYLVLSKQLSHLYRKNYDKIVLHHTNKNIFYHTKDKEMDVNKIIDNIISRFVGVEIISQTPEKTVLECFTTKNYSELGVIEKRIYFLFKETIEEMLDKIGNDFEEFDKIVYSKHDNITKFINYFLRELNRSEKSGEEKTVAYSFYSHLDTLIDKIRHTSNSINNFGCNKKMKEFSEQILRLFLDVYKALIFNKPLDEVLINRRYVIKKKIKNSDFTSKEARLLIDITYFLESYNHFTDYMLIRSATGR